jgi:cell wall-associated NlpC family hydrolase
LVPAAWPGTYVPNFSDWQEGDIVLVHRTPDSIGLGIQASQAASFSPVTRAGAVCSHAAIYVGAGMVVDATVSAGVSAQSVWNYCQTRAIQVRRLTDPSIPMADIADIAVEAQRHIGRPYSLLQAIVSKVVPGSVPTPNALYCSTFVGLVVANATGYDLSFDPQHQPLHPGTLAAHPDLTDVLLEWRHL